MSEKTIRVRVTPRSRKESLIEKNGILHISVKEAAERGMANDRVREIVAAHFMVPLKSVRIHTGHTGRSKNITIRS